MRARHGASLAVAAAALIIGTTWLAAQAPAPAAGPAGRERTLLYAAVPNTNIDNGGAGILIFDRNADWKLLKRIPLWDYTALNGPGNFRGISAHAETHRLFVTNHRGAAAFDLITDKMLWHTDALDTGLFDNGDCCDNGHVTADGKFVIVGSRQRKDRWWVLDANTGTIVKELPIPDLKRPHNIVMSPDGSKAYVAGVATRQFGIIDTKTFQKIGLVGPVTNDTRTFTINGAGTKLYVTMVDLLGFEILDLTTGKMIERVEVPGFTWQGKDYGHQTPSHGVALSPDEKEVWVDNNVDGYIHIYDNTVTPKKIKESIKTDVAEAEWIIFSIDGKLVYSATGEVFDYATHQKLHQLTDEYGRPVRTEKMLEVTFQNGKVTKVGERGGLGKVGGPRSTSQQQQ